MGVQRTLSVAAGSFLAVLPGKGNVAPFKIDIRVLDLRAALDFAIGNEEDSQLRYQEFAARVTNPQTAEFFRRMAVNESKHRQQLEARRDVLFRNSTRHFDTSIVDEDGWLPGPNEVSTKMLPREAVELALRAELQSRQFYAAAVQNVENPDVRVLFEDLTNEEGQHAAALRRMLEDLPPEP